jgi:hypothetical protein
MFMSPLIRPLSAGLSQVFDLSVWNETTDLNFDPSETLRPYPMELTSLEDFVKDRVAEFASAEVSLSGA